MDKILLGGLQLPMYSSSVSRNDKTQGIIITLKGCKGTDKTMLAMQVMHGITKSLRRYNGEDALLAPAFYSLDKTHDQLNDILLDFIISQCTRKMIKLKQDLRKDSQYNNSLFADIIFKTDQKVYTSQEQCDNTPLLPDDLCARIDKYISEGIVFYNIRTNSLHFRTAQSKDTQTNMLFERKYNLIHQYLSDVNRFSGDYTKIDDFRNDFFDVEFNSTEADDVHDNFIYTRTPAHRLTQIISKIQERQNKGKDEKETRIIPCTVIDGISQVRKQELEGFEISSIERLLRDTSLVSVIVIDDVEEDMFHSDISIEMRRVENDEVNYTTHQLRVNKSVFQMTAYGWHQYKKRDYGIEVYPSSHLLLHQKRYLPQSIINTKNGILDRNYLQYLDFSKDCDEKEQYVDYDKRRVTEEYNRLRYLYVSRFYKALSTPDDVLGYLLAQKNTTPDGKTIAIIGYPNTFKRFLAIGSSFCAARKGYHTLFLTFDRLSSNLLQQMQCPAFVSMEKTLPCVEGITDEQDEKIVNYTSVGTGQCSLSCPYNCSLKKCKRCYDYLHVFNVNMGCISADELLYYLEEQLEIYFDKQGSKIKRIIFDDLQKVDFCFPLLKSNDLFFAALKNFCQKKGVDLMILCDKKAGLVDELISLSENVICMCRDKDPRKVTFLIEKFAGNILPSQIYEITTTHIYDLFECDFSNCRLTVPDNIEEIGSMTDFWNDSWKDGCHKENHMGNVPKKESSEE